MNRGIEEVPLVPLVNGAAPMTNGHHRPRFASSITVPPNLQLTLSWQNIDVNHYPSRSCLGRLKGERPPEVKRILKGVSGVADPGTLTALMGSSGAGKTTLLNVLNQRGLAGLEVKGNVYLNGIPIDEYGRSTSKLIGYVQQHDILPSELTVREYLTFCATLTMSKHLPQEAKLAKVDEILEEFSLRKCADTTIRGKQSVSGGERKRVSVATKLFAEPRLLFLDEPTTGLDSYMAALLVKNLRDLASQGYNIICTIHQPSADVFNLFDQLLLLADGTISYFGPQPDALSYFSGIGYPCPDEFSPADYFIALLAVVPGQEKGCLERIRRIADEYTKSTYTDKARHRLAIELEKNAVVEDIISEDQEMGYQAGWFTQSRLIIWRGLIYFRRNPALLKTRALFVAFMCLIMALIFWNPTATYDQTRITAVRGLLYFFCANFTFVNAARMLVVLPGELPLMIREHLDGMYCISAYYFATLISQCSLGITLMALSVTSVYFVGGLEPRADTFFICLGILLLSYLVNVGFVAMQSALWEKPGRSVTLTAPQIFVMNVLGGFYINPRSIATYLLPILYIDWVPWSYELLNINQWVHVKSIACEWSQPESCLPNGQAVMETYGFSVSDYTTDFLLISGQVIAYNALTLTILKMKMKYKWSG
ncbi:protein white-like [Diadema antillarum]|uniref:protein white-like n=1 Tax=Diadema antillarum TaxID=105358 RepID=UPI003A850E59